VLAKLPTLRSLLPDPAVEGDESEAFPACRKTTKELYRWIANTHYEHLAAVVPALENVHAAGCDFGTFLKTKSRAQFIGHTGEVLVAEDLLHRGYRVTTVPRSKEVTPDFTVAVEGITVAVEVYGPRELAAVDDWIDELKDLVMHVDLPVDYDPRVGTKLAQSIPPPREPFDPWAPAKIIEQTRKAVIAEIQHDVEAALRELEPLSKTYQHGETQPLTTVELDNVRRADHPWPVRNGSLGPPGLSGYSPVGVFHRTVEKALNKADEGQTHGVPADARILVVYMMGTKIYDDLLVEPHKTGAEEVLAEVEPQQVDSTRSPSSSASSREGSRRSSRSSTTGR
jgi:hypothetical protein